MEFQYASKIREGVSLSSFSTWRIGGKAKFFFEADDREQLRAAVGYVERRGLSFFILGGGSNILASDKGFDGLAIKIKNQDISVIAENEAGKIMKFGAGVLLAKAFILAKQEGLTGLEWAFGIPGTIGGAVCGNAGAYGKNIGVAVKEVEILRGGKFIALSAKDCSFAYRNSRFKSRGNKDIVVSATLNFKKGDKKEIDKTIQEIMASRKGRHPNDPSAGSVFKNIELKNYSGDFQKQIPADKIKNGFVASAFLIEQCGLKGRQAGQAKISEIHANYFINLGGAKSSDIEELIKITKAEVFKKYNIHLEEEIVLI